MFNGKDENIFKTFRVKFTNHIFSSVLVEQSRVPLLIKMKYVIWINSFITTAADLDKIQKTSVESIRVTNTVKN